MSTVVLNAYTIAFPTITNRVKADVATQANPLAVVATQTFNAPHPSRIISFPGLPRTNYVFTMNEIDGAGAIIQQLAFFDIVPGDLLDGIFRAEEQIKVGVTTGLVAGTTSFTFDGTAGKPDYRDWEISPEEYGGVGTMIRGVDYSWDKVTGIFNWVRPNAIFEPNQWFTIEFETKKGGTNSAPSFIDFSMRLITADTTLLVTDLGMKLIVEPAGNSLILTLPALSTSPSGRPVLIETQSIQAFKCVQIKPSGTDVIKWQFGSLYMMMNESLSLYCCTLAGGRTEWRVNNLQGNFAQVGRLVGEDLSNTYNRVLVDGSSLDKFQYGRLYNEVVLRLPVSQFVNYDNWPSNPTFFSLANSSIPANLNKFHVPDRRGFFEKANASPRVVGSYEPDTIGLHEHMMFTDEDVADVGYIGATSFVTRAAGLGGNPSYRLQQSSNQPSVGRSARTGTSETNVKNYSINKYILV